MQPVFDYDEIDDVEFENLINSPAIGSPFGIQGSLNGRGSKQSITPFWNKVASLFRLRPNSGIGYSSAPLLGGSSPYSSVPPHDSGYHNYHSDTFNASHVAVNRLGGAYQPSAVRQPLNDDEDEDEVVEGVYNASHMPATATSGVNSFAITKHHVNQDQQQPFYGALTNNIMSQHSVAEEHDPNNGLLGQMRISKDNLSVLSEENTQVPSNGSNSLL